MIHNGLVHRNVYSAVTRARLTVTPRWRASQVTQCSGIWNAIITVYIYHSSVLQSPPSWTIRCLGTLKIYANIRVIIYAFLKASYSWGVIYFTRTRMNYLRVWPRDWKKYLLTFCTIYIKTVIKFKVKKKSSLLLIKKKLLKYHLTIW